LEHPGVQSRDAPVSGNHGGSSCERHSHDAGSGDRADGVRHGAGTGATRQATRSAPASDTLRLPFETVTLPNGLTVILSPDKTTPTVAVNVWYKVGSKNEAVGRTGFAHLFEHVMFTGSGNVPYGLHDKLTEGIGGSNNGTTNNDRTTYFERSDNPATTA
jgi:zinc protease